MKKIISSICLLLLVFTAIAQSQADIDKMMKQMQDVMKNVSPEEKEQMNNLGIKIPKDAKDMKELMNKPRPKPNLPEPKEVNYIGTVTTKNIGAAGGFIVSENGKIRLDFPAGALSQNTEINIEETENGESFGCGDGFKFTPDGQTFNKPVMLTIKYSQRDIDGTCPQLLNIMTQDNNGDWYANTETTIDTINSTVTATIPHFSSWILGAKMKLALKPQNANVIKGHKIELSVIGWEIKRPDLGTAISDKKMEEIYGLPTKNFVSLADIKKIDNSLNRFAIDEWTLDEHPAPYKDNKKGKLTALGATAEFTAPEIMPVSPNDRIVAIKVNLKEYGKTDKGGFITYPLISFVNIVDEGTLIGTIDNLPVKGYQGGSWQEYGEDGAIYPGVADAFVMDDGTLSVSFSNDFEKKTSLGFKIFKPGVGNFKLGATDGVCLGSIEGKNFSYGYSKCKYINGKCDCENIISPLDVTITRYDDEMGGILEGKFSGNLYENLVGAKCMSSIKHTVSGTFLLTVLKFPGSKATEITPKNPTPTSKPATKPVPKKTNQPAIKAWD